MPPGVPNWDFRREMPMIWEGLSDGQICRLLKDPKQNKNRISIKLVEHLTEDKLVMWGWNLARGGRLFRCRTMNFSEGERGRLREPVPGGYRATRRRRARSLRGLHYGCSWKSRTEKTLGSTTGKLLGQAMSTQLWLTMPRMRFSLAPMVH